MEKHYFIKLDTMREFAVQYGTDPESEAHIKTYIWLWRAKLLAWWKNRGLTGMREFNDHQAELFSGASLELPEE